jgi:hypothetical protein
MTRVSSQKIRQALLVTGDPLDPSTLPEKIQLLLNPGQTEAREVELYPSVRLYKIATNRPARLRMYPTATMRDADANRGIGVRPVGNHGRLLEVVTSGPLMLELILSPAVDITSVNAFNSTFYVSVTNLDTVPGPVVVTYSYFRTE